MQFKFKIAGAFAILMLIVVVLFTAQYMLTNQTPNISPAGNYNLVETFTSQSFSYGPQGWAPYNTKLPLLPGGNVDSESYYLMFVDLNATSNLNSTFPCVRVDYTFSGLQGTAAFHLYGYIQSNGGISWTNRVDGVGASGWYVVGNAPVATSAISSEVKPLPDHNHIAVKVVNQKGATFNDFGNNTYYLKFEKAGGGLNSMHITADPRSLSGEVTQTGNQTGTFYVSFTGDRFQDDLLLLVAVNGNIGSNFQLNLKSSVP